MLEEISINNLGIIRSATLPFTPGLTVITGETGAGKTMVLSGLRLLTGCRSDASMVGPYSSSLSVEGLWDVSESPYESDIKDTGAVIEDDQLFINRTVQNNGKSRAVLGGKTTPVSILSSIGSKFVNIHGQSDQIRLKSTSNQRDSLDSYAGKKLQEALSEYQKTFALYVSKKKMIDDVKKNSTSRKREIESLKRFVEEFDKIAPVDGELDELTREIEALSNIDDIRQGVSEAIESVSPSNDEVIPTTEQLRMALRSISSVEEYDAELLELSKSLLKVIDDLEDFSTNLHRYADSLDEDSLNRLYEAQERESVLKRFVRKYGSSLDEVIEEYSHASSKLEELEELTQPAEALEKELSELVEKVQKLADKVSDLRQKASSRLESEIDKELSGLSMASSKMVVQVSKTTLSNSGQDEVEFMLRSGGQSDPRPIAKSASGGELSRIMLALEVVLADPKTTPTFVFDEVDSGVGGGAAIEIGKRLAKLSSESQVIVVTHLPQVAAFADNHLKVVKTSTEVVTETSVNQLNDHEVVQEITRMLSGMTNSDSGKAHAMDLLKLAKEYKESFVKK